MHTLFAMKQQSQEMHSYVRFYRGHKGVKRCVSSGDGFGRPSNVNEATHLKPPSLESHPRRTYSTGSVNSLFGGRIEDWLKIWIFTRTYSTAPESLEKKNKEWVKFFIASFLPCFVRRQSLHWICRTKREIKSRGRTQWEVTSNQSLVEYWTTGHLI